MKKQLKWVLLALVAVGCDDEQIENYLRVQYAQYNFTAEQNSLSVKVECTGDWKVDSTIDWMTATKSDDNSFMVEVKANESAETRTATITIKSDFETQKLEIIQKGTYFQGRVREFYEVISPIAMSRNGKYVAYTLTDKNGNSIPIVEDMETGHREAYPDGIEGYYSVVSVSDDGTGILLRASSGNPYIMKDGMLYALDFGNYASATVIAMSADGNLIVGAVKDAKRTEYPACWREGVLELLETPEEDPMGNTMIPHNVKIKGCSTDGKVIYGAEYRSKGYGLIYWKDGVMYYPGKEEAQVKEVIYNSGSKIYSEKRPCTVGWHEDMNNGVAISPNGRYLAARFNDYEWIDEQTPSPEIYIPVCVDLETGKVIKIDAGMPNAVGMAVDDEGHVFAKNIAKGDSNFNSCIVFNSIDYSAVSVSDFFKNQYGIELSDFRLIYQVGGDGKSFFGKKDSTYWYLHL